MRLAAIDIGSNSIKMLVVNAISSESFVVTAREKESVRLGHETLRSRRLSSEAIDRAAETIKRFRTIAEQRGAEKICAVATASVRAAENSAEFIESIERLTGVRVEIIPGIEEARLVGIAAAAGCGHKQSLLNIDIGGGSTELSVVSDGLPQKLFSVKLGAVGLTERFLTQDPPSGDEIACLQDEIRAALERPARELQRGARWQKATGTSGTILAIGEIVGAPDKSAETGENGEKQGRKFTLDELERFCERVAALGQNERLKKFDLSEQRAEIIIAGSFILRGAMRVLRIKELSTCYYALREGVVIDALRNWEESMQPPLPDLQEPRLRGVMDLGKRYNFEEKHSLQIARLAEAIFDGLAARFSLDREHRILLSAAALLHDIGYYVSHESHHKHSSYLIKNSELIGFTEEQRNVIAAVARYHRGALPKEKHREMSDLNARLHHVVMKLGGILRLADALDRSYDNRVENVRVRVADEKIMIALEGAKDCQREIQTARQKSDLFEFAFNRALEIS